MIWGSCAEPEAAAQRGLPGIQNESPWGIDYEREMAVETVVSKIRVGVSLCLFGCIPQNHLATWEANSLLSSFSSINSFSNLSFPCPP